MSNQISFMVRVIDMTKQGLASAEKGLQSFAKGAGFGQLGKMASLGAAGVALAFGTLAKNVIKWAEEIRGASKGAFDDFAVSGAKAIGNVSDKMSMFWDAVKGNVVGALGSYFSGGESATTDAMVEQVKKAEELKKLQLERIAKAKEQLMTEGDLLNVKVAQLNAVIDELNKHPQNRDALEKRLALEKSILDLNKSITKEEDSRAKQAMDDIKAEDDAWNKALKDRSESEEKEAEAIKAARIKAIEEAGEEEKRVAEESHAARVQQLNDEIELRMVAAAALEGKAKQAEARGLGTMATRRAAKDAQRAESEAEDDARRERAKTRRVMEKAREGRTLSGDEKRIKAAADDRFAADQEKIKLDHAKVELADQDNQYKGEMKRLTELIAKNVGAVV